MVMAEEEGASAMYRAPRTLLETLRTDLIVSIDRFARINYRWNNYEFNSNFLLEAEVPFRLQ